MHEINFASVFDEDDIVPVPENRIRICVPKYWNPQKEEFQVLDRLLSALGFKQGQRRFFYHGGSMDGFLSEGVATPLFFFSEDELEKPAKNFDESVNADWYLLPPISQMIRDSELKRRVWELLKADF